MTASQELKTGAAGCTVDQISCCATPKPRTHIPQKFRRSDNSVLRITTLYHDMQMAFSPVWNDCCNVVVSCLMGHNVGQYKLRTPHLAARSSHSNNVTNLASFKVTEQQPHVDITKVGLGRSRKAGEAGDHNYHRVTSAKRLNLSASTASPEFASETRESTNIEVCIKVRSDACLDFTSPSTVNFRPTNSHFLLSHRHSLLHPQIHTADQNQHALHCSRTSGDHRLSCLGADFQRVCLS
jgi:hypothetical protein